MTQDGKLYFGAVMALAVAACESDGNGVNSYGGDACACDGGGGGDGSATAGSGGASEAVSAGDGGEAGDGGPGEPDDDGGSERDGGDPADALEVVRFQDVELQWASSPVELYTGRDIARYRGLQCVAWNLGDAGGARFDLINVPESCGFYNEGTLWRGKARQGDDGRLRLEVIWDFAFPNACGSGLYLFSFEIADLAIDARLPVEIATRSCTDGCGWQDYFVEIPADEQNAGISCRYLGTSSLWPEEQLEPGSLLGAPEDGTCDQDLVVIATDTGDICAEPCTEDADCSLPEIFSCQEQACRLTEPWVDGNG